MLEAVTSKTNELAEVCLKHRVKRLAVFGSAATAAGASGGDSDASDVDLLVEFRRMSPAERAESYLGLAEDVERLLGLPGDLVESAAVRNPYFRRAVERTQVVVDEGA